MKVVCIGFSKTGTSSMERALEMLGYNVCNGYFMNNYSNYLMGLFVNGDYERILRLMEDFDAFADAPWGGSTLYRQIEDRYRDCKFILTTRKTDAWLNSLKNMFFDTDPNIETTFGSFYSSGAYGFCDFVRHTFGVDSLVGADPALRTGYDSYNTDTLAYFTGRQDFLHFELEQASWEPLCAFLGKDVPEEDYPNMNARTESEDQKILRLTLTEAYEKFIECLAHNDRESAEIIMPLLLDHDAPHFGNLLRTGLINEREQSLFGSSESE